MTGSIQRIPSCSSSYTPSNTCIHITPPSTLIGDHASTSNQKQPSHSLSFFPTQTMNQVFFYQCYELGLIDENGTWLKEIACLPPVDNEGIQRIYKRLSRKITTVTKDLKHLNPRKFEIIKKAIDTIAQHCAQEGKKNPFSIDAEDKVALIEINMELSTLLKKIIQKRNSIYRVEINGGDLPSILGSNWYKVIKEFDKDGHFDLDWDLLLQNIDVPAHDLDLTLHVPVDASYEEMEEVIQSVIDTIAEKLAMKNDLFDTLALLVKELAFSKFSHIYDTRNGAVNHFFTLSFCDVNHTKIDLCFAANLIQKQLFHRHGLKLDITDLLHPEAKKDLNLVPYSDVSGGWQAIFDRIARVVNAGNTHLPFHHGWVRLISSLISGNSCPRKDLESTLRKEIHLWSPQYLAENLHKITLDHNKADFDALIAAAFISSTLLQDHFSEDAIANMWSTLHQYSNKVHESVLFKLATMIWDQELSFRQISQVIHAVSLYHMSQSSSHDNRYQLINFSGKPCISVSFKNEIAILLFYQPQESMENFSILLSGSHREAALKVFRLLLDIDESPHSKPSILSLYPTLHSPLKRHLNTLPSYHEINLIKLSLKLVICEKTEESLLEMLTLLIPLIYEEPEKITKIKLLNEIQYNFNLTFPFLKSYITHQGKSLFGIYKSLLKDLTAEKNTKLCQCAYTIWHRLTKNLEFHQELGWDLLDLFIHVDPLLSLKILAKLAKHYPVIETEYYDKFISYIDHLRKVNLTLECDLMTGKILLNILSKQKKLNKKFHQYNHQLETHITAILYEMINHNFLQEANELIRMAIEKKVFLSDHSDAPRAWLELFRKMLLNPVHSLMECIENLEDAKRLNLVKQLEKTPSYHQLLFSLATRCLDEGMEDVHCGYLQSVDRSFLDTADATKMQELIDRVIHKKIASGEIKSVADISREAPYSITKEQIQRYQIQLIYQALHLGEIEKAKDLCLNLIRANGSKTAEIKPALIALTQKEHYSAAIEILSETKISSYFSTNECKAIITPLLALTDTDQKTILNIALKYIDDLDESYFDHIYPYFYNYMQYYRIQTPLSSLITHKIPLIVEVLFHRGRVDDLLSIFRLMHIHQLVFENKQIFVYIYEAIKQSYKSSNNLSETLSQLNICFSYAKNFMFDSTSDHSAFLIPFLENLLSHKDYENAYLWISRIPEHAPEQIWRQFFYAMITGYDDRNHSITGKLISKCPIKEVHEWISILEIAVTTLPKSLLEELSIQLYNQIFNNHIVGETSGVARCLLLLLNPELHCPSSLIIEMIDQFSGLSKGPDYEFVILLLSRCIDAIKFIGNIDPYIEKVLKFRNAFENCPHIDYLITYDIDLIKLASKTQCAETYYQASLTLNTLLKNIRTHDHNGMKEGLLEFLLKYAQFDQFEPQHEETMKECVLNLLNLFRVVHPQSLQVSEQICRRFSKIKSKFLQETLLQYYVSYVKQLEENCAQGHIVHAPQFLEDILTQIIHHTDFTTGETCMKTITNLSILTSKVQDSLWNRLLCLHLNRLLSTEYTLDDHHLFKSCIYCLEFLKHDLDKLTVIINSLFQLAFRFNEYEMSNPIVYQKSFQNLAQFIFCDVFKRIPDIAIPAILLSPKEKLWIKHPNGAKAEISAHLSNPLTAKASTFYVSLLLKFCEFLMSTKHINDENAIRSIDFVFNTLMKLITTQSHRRKELSLVVHKFCFFPIQLSDESIYEYNIKKGIELYRNAVNNDIFINNKYRLLNCIYFCELNEWVGSGIPDQKRLETIELIIKDIIHHGNIPALRHGFNMIKSLARFLFKKHPNQFVDRFSQLIHAFKHVHNSNVLSIFTLDEHQQDKLSYKSIMHILGSSPHLSEVNDNLYQIGTTIKFIPFYESIEHILLPNKTLLFSNEKTASGTKHSLQLVCIFVDALLEVDENNAKLSYFLCNFVRTIKKVNGYYSNPSVYLEHVAKIRDHLAWIVNNPMFQNRQLIYGGFYKLLFQDPSIENIHPWIRILLNSNLPEDIRHGKAILEKALRTKLYVNNMHLLIDIKTQHPLQPG